MELIEETKGVHPSREEKEGFWNEHRKHQKESGLSGRAYCKKNQLSYRQFSYWSDRGAQQERASKLMPIQIEALPKVTSSQGTDTVCTLVFKKGYELKVHDQSLLPMLLSLL